MHHPVTRRAASRPALASDRPPASAAGRAAAARRRGWAARWRRAHDCAVFYGLLALFGAISLLWSAVAGALYRLLPRGIGEQLGQFVMRAGFRGFVGAMRLSGALDCDFSVLDALAGAPPLVIAPNHPSLLDAALVLSRVPHVVGAAKAEIWDNVFLGGGARLAGFIRNDSPARLVKEAVRQLRGGRHVLIFPEGTRSSASPIGEFKGGFALIAKRAGAAVQPVFIETTSHFLGKGWPLFKRPDLPLVYRFRLGRRVAVEGDVHAAVDRLHGYYQRALDAGDR